MDIRRTWAMPSKHTFTIPPIRVLVEETMLSCPGLWIDPFAGESRIATITNDLNPIFDTDFHLKAHDFLARFDDESVDGILLDPPYSPRQIKECYDGVGEKLTTFETQSAFWGRLKTETKRILRQGGKVIMCGWNANGVGESRDFEKQRILLVDHGGWHNSTIVTVERKLAWRENRATTPTPTG